jgi:hypothetical protein
VAVPDAQSLVLPGFRPESVHAFVPSTPVNLKLTSVFGAPPATIPAIEEARLKSG